MKPLLHIITQCTDRKRLEVPTALRLREFRQTAEQERAEAWVTALRGATRRSPARDLYAGEHWVASLDALTVARERGFEAQLWVASAGLGLISAEATVPAYSATFARASPDTVVRRQVGVPDQRRAWWEALGRTRMGARVTLKQLVSSPETRLLLIMSRAYLQAVLPELSAAEVLLSSERCVILTADAPEVAGTRWAAHWVPSRARLTSVIGGTRVGQHARLARDLLRDVPAENFGADAWRSCAERWLQAAPEVVRPMRAPMSDEEVREFVRESKLAFWSRALRKLRESGRACEQKRFRQLFREVRA